MQEMIEESPELTGEDQSRLLEMIAEQEEAAARQEAERRARVASLGSDLYGELTQRKALRTAKEKEMLDALYAYEGKYTPLQLKEIKGTLLFVNITRPKTDAFCANIADIAIPTEDFNWDVEPSVEPEISRAKSSTKVVEQTAEGAPVLEKDMARGVVEEARERCDAMRKKMQDQHQECGYNSEFRRAIDYGGIYGTMIMRGPTKASRPRRKWENLGNNTFALKYEDQQDKIEFAAVNPFNFYPDSFARSIAECESIYETFFLTKKTLRGMAQSGFDKDAIKLVIQTSEGSTLPDWFHSINTITANDRQTAKGLYEAWWWHGDLPADKVRDLMGEEVADSLDEDLDTVPASVWGVGSIVIHASMNPSDTGEIPYSVCPIVTDEGSIFGHGIPWVGSNAQESINSAWRMAIDNAAASVAPQVVLDKRYISPADGKWEFRPRKVWYLDAEDGESVNARDAIQFFNVSSNLNELLAILKTAMEMFDQEMNFSLVMSGDTSQHSPETAKGTQILYNAGRVVVRRVVKQIDDFITIPNIRRQYDHNMQFVDDPAIKGDMYPVAKGSSVLMERQEQIQALNTGAEIILNPTFEHIFDQERFAEEFAKNLRLNRVIRSKDEREAKLEEIKKRQPQTDPRVQIEMEKLKLSAQEHQDKMQIALRELGLTEQEFAAKYGVEQGRVGIEKMKIDSDNARFNTEMTFKARTGQPGV